MITAVIDTHGLLNSIPRNSEKRWLYDAFVSKQFVWVFSNEILSEYAEMIAIEFSEKAMQSVVSTLLTAPNTNRFDPFFKWQLVEADPDARSDGPQQVCRLRHRFQCRLSGLQ